MAEGETSRWSSAIMCRYYLHGVCKSGVSCRYSHDVTAKQSNVCRYYLKGCCSFGDSCRYDHVKPKPEQVSQPEKPYATPQTSKPVKTAEKPALNSNMTKLTKDGSTPKKTPLFVSPTGKSADDWVKAVEFIPGQKWSGAGPTSYSGAAKTGVEDNAVTITEESAESSTTLHPELCPFAAFGECRFGENCTYLHGDRCDLCGKAVLHPDDKEQREKHAQECVKNLEEDMELSFAVQRSKKLTCGICMDIVWEKLPQAECRFGILSNCNHIFCLSCIRKWRSAKQFENKIVRACPECRTKSDFITPSKYWVEDKEEKLKLIGGYKQALSTKPCKYFDQGRKECPFNENCFYLHAYPDGRKASPKPITRRKRKDADGEIDLIGQIILWDFLQERNLRMLPLEFDDMDLDDLIFQLNFADSSDDESDFSDFEFFSI